MTKLFPRGLVAGLAVAAALTAPVNLSNAATDGSLGPTSTGTLNINLTIPQHVRISRLDDIILVWDLVTDPLLGTDAMCVYSSTRNYVITATGSGAANAFTVTDGTNTIAYTVAWTDDNGPANQAMLSGVPLVGQSASTNSVNCNNGDNSTVRVSFTAANMTAGPSGVYTGVLTLLVAPQ